MNTETQSKFARSICKPLSDTKSVPLKGSIDAYFERELLGEVTV